jgi:hypothetical protein
MLTDVLEEGLSRRAIQKLPLFAIAFRELTTRRQESRKTNAIVEGVTFGGF